MQRSEYFEKYNSEESRRLRASIARDKWRLQYHIQPPQGWLNDPNGLCILNDQVQIYYQYSPFEPQGGMKIWGHVTTKDYVHYTQHHAALFSDHSHDRSGVYSGSAYTEDGIAYIFYTGNVKHTPPEGKTYDYIYEGRGHNVILVTTTDGIHFSQKKVVLENKDYPADMSCHVRDPKVWKEKDGRYYMVLGTRTVEDRGAVLIYVSDNLHDWSLHMRLDADPKLGYMLECPDLFNLEGTWFLLSCPQGMKAQGDLFNNVYQYGYQTLDIDLSAKTYKFTSEFTELDYGFEMYAPQTFVDQQGRRILIAWFGLPDIEYKNPTTEQGYTHCLAIPRVLENHKGRLVQRPVPELRTLRRTSLSDAALTTDGFIQGVKDAVYELDFRVTQSFEVALRQDVKLAYDKDAALVTLTLGDSGYGREVRRLHLDQALMRVQVFSDTSSLEIFFNNGLYTMSTRTYFNEQDECVVSLLQGEVERPELYHLDSIMMLEAKKVDQEELEASQLSTPPAYPQGK